MILAARALGLYCGPMSGFDNASSMRSSLQWVSGIPGQAPAYAGPDFLIARDGRDAIDFVVATVNAFIRIVEHAILVPELFEGGASA